MILDIYTGEHVVIRALLDKDDNIVEATGDMADYVDDLEKWGSKTGEALISRLGRSSGVSKYDGNTLEPITTTPPPRKRPTPPKFQPAKEVEKGGPPFKGVVVVAIPEDPSVLAVSGGLPSNEIHATLGYLGKVDDVVLTDIEKIKDFVDGYSASFVAKVGGVGKIGNDDPQATVLHIEAQELQDMRERLTSVVTLNSTHPHYSPHITVGYGVPLPENHVRDVRISHIEAWIGGVHYKKGDRGVTKEAIEIAEIGELAKIDADRREVFGWAYQTHDKDGNVVFDKSGEFIDDVRELEDAAYSFVVKARTGGVDHRKNEDGSPLKVGTMIESVVFTPEKVEKMGLPPGTVPNGWWVGFKVEDDQTWQDVKEGRKLAFSIQGKAVRKEVDI